MRLAVLLLLAACSPAPEAPPADPACPSACARLRALGCPEGQGAKGGESCESICERTRQHRTLPLSCWAGAETVAVAKSCGALRCLP